MPAMGGAPTVGGPLSEDKLFASLPQGTQGRFDALPTQAQKALKTLSAQRQ